MSKLSIVIPVYWNADSLKPLYLDLKKKVLPALDDYEIVFVDDGSGDNSWEIIRQLKAEDPHIVAVKLSRNFGEHAALMAGLSVCSGDCAVTKQADMQEESELILRMYDSWKNGNKVVIAARRTRKDGAGVVFFANLYYKLVRKHVTDRMPVGGFDCFLLDRRAIGTISQLNETNTSLILQVLWIGYPSEVVYFDRQDREVGQSRWTFSKKMKLFMDSFIGFSYLPIRLMWIVGVLFFIFAVCMGISTLVEYFTVGTPVAGWSSLICVVLMASGLILWMLGIIGEYVWRSFDAARRRPPFIIDEILKG